MVVHLTLLFHCLLCPFQEQPPVITPPFIGRRISLVNRLFIDRPCLDSGTLARIEPTDRQLAGFAYTDVEYNSGLTLKERWVDYPASFPYTSSSPTSI